jgi:hypothetical protein
MPLATAPPVPQIRLQISAGDGFAIYAKFDRRIVKHGGIKQ